MRGQAVARRTFWWDRTGPDAEVEPLRAVIFDLDAMAELDADGEFAPRAGLIDLVMNLFVAGIWVGVVSTGRRADVDPLVRELIGDGLVETIVTADDTDFTDTTHLYESALWEFGIRPEEALAFVGSSDALDAATDAGLAAVRPATAYSDNVDCASDCQRLHRRWWTGRKLEAVA
ncbi:MAG TPA: HAD hydrolase-like protein [Mycobacterium sp.]|nr:HAD hydrolase-like protein [Mycobacterium sp.]